MKIQNNDQIMKNLYPETKNNSPTPAGKEFGSILKERVEKSKNEVMDTQQSTFLRPLSGIQMNAPFRLDRSLALERIENLIGLLDQYRSKLADPGTTLKNIDPIIKQIDLESEKLAPALDSLPPEDELKDLMNQTLVTASLEVTKFYRGDYMDS